MNQEHTKKEKIYSKPWVKSLAAVVLIFGGLFGYLYWESTKNTVSTENAYLDAPIVAISPSSPGILNALYVKEGDRVEANSPIALVGAQTLYSKDGGIVASAPNVLGSYFSPGQSVVSIIYDREMKVVGSLDETKGLDKVFSGLRATFTVDAFPGRTYEGTVDEVSPNSNETGVAFSISDKRPVKKFNIYIRFDAASYPELKTGMSAKIKVYTK